MARRHRRGFGSPPSVHRAIAGSYAQAARSLAQKARIAARAGNCRDALHYFGVAAFQAGIARGHRASIGRKGPGAGHIGARIHDLQKMVFKACRVG